MALFHDDKASVQLFYRSREKACSSPEEHLLMALLEDAIHSFFGVNYTKGHTETVTDRLKIQADAWAWLTDRTQYDEWPFACSSVCSALDIDQEYIIGQVCKRAKIKEDEAIDFEKIYQDRLVHVPEDVSDKIRPRLLQGMAINGIRCITGVGLRDVILCKEALEKELGRKLTCRCERLIDHTGYCEYRRPKGQSKRIRFVEEEAA